MFAKKRKCKVRFLNWFCIDKKCYFSQIILFSKSKFTVIYTCMNCIDFYKFENSILREWLLLPYKIE